MSNPFGNYEENPFEDAAVVNAAEFGDEGNAPEPEPIPEKKGKKGGKKGDEDRLFSGQSSSSAPPPPYAAPSPAPVVDDSVRRKEEELRRKEEELQARQRQFEQQQAANPNGPKVPNWPPFKPYIYHSIPDEIPPEWQKLVRNFYYSWFFTVGCLFLNVIACMCILIAGLNGQDFGFSFMYFFVITPLSFLLWYRPLYNAFMKDSSFYFFTFLTFGGCHILFELYIIMGGPTTGSGGFINMADLFGKKHYGEGVVVLINLLFWILLCGVHIFLYRLVYRVYKSRGHSFQSARNQAFTSAAQSQAGREAMSAAVTGAAQGMMAGAQHA